MENSLDAEPEAFQCGTLLAPSADDESLRWAKVDGARQKQLNSPSIRQRMLMCAPEHFGVDYVINPWMENQVGNAVHTLAKEQWTNLRRHLAQETEIALVAPEPGLPDMVFTANAGLVTGGTVVHKPFPRQATAVGGAPIPSLVRTPRFRHRALAGRRAVGRRWRRAVRSRSASAVVRPWVSLQRGGAGAARNHCGPAHGGIKARRPTFLSS